MEFLSYTPQLQRLMEALGLTLLHSLWQGLLLMLILWALLKLIRYQRANLRFGLALAALFLLLTAFAVTFYDRWENLKPVAAVSQELNAIDFPLTKPIVSEVEPTFWEQIQREANRIFFQLSENAVWMAGLWLLGSLFFSARLGLGLWQVRQLRQQRMPLPEHWQQVAADLQQKLGIRRRVNFSSSEQVETPLTLGWLRPLILLPSAMLTAMPTEQLESILVHELAHIRRHDYPWNLLQSLAEVILFYHPTYWYMASMLEQERELACDAITLQVTGRPQVYAQALLQVATLRTTFSPVALSVKGSARSRSGFGERIKRIVMPDYQKKSVQPLPFLLSFCLIGMLLFAFTLKSPVGEEEFDGKQGGFEIEDLAETNADSLRAPDYFDYRNNVIENDSQEDIPRIDEKLKERLNQRVQPVKKAEVKIQYEAKVISGIITDAETGKPLPGTNILIKGTTTGTVSNREGAFRINIPEEGKALIFVHIGYKDEVISLEGKETMDVSLKPLSAEAKQKRIEELEKKRAERISSQLPALSSLDSTLIVVDGQARKEVKSLSELNIQPDEILAINVMGTEADLSKYLDASDQGRYKKVVKIITKGYDTSKRPTPPEEGKPLFIVDGEVRQDIKSFEELESAVILKSPHSISASPIGDVVVPSLSKEQLKQYEKVITIKTSKTFDPGDIESRIQGKVVDAESGEPIEGVKISDIHKKEVIAVTDPTGEYRLVLDNPKEKVFIMYEAPGYRRYVVPACADCVVSSTFPSVLVFPMKKETEQKRAYKQESNVVRGQVVDAESGKPLPGINVLFKGSTTGTVSNPEGKFQIQIPEGGEELRFFFIGYEEEVVAVEGKENISISLKPLSEEEKKKQLDKLRQERAQENENTPLANSPLQSENIQGQVVDAETGQEIPGANILIKGTTIGTVSDMEGRYSLQLAEGAETLVISFIGYAKKEVSVEDASRIELQSPDRSKIPKQSKTSDSGLKVIGKITDSETGESLKGVRVFKGDQFIGRITHPTGIFTMPVQSFDDTLTFRKDGYRSVTVALNGRKKIDIALEKPSLNSALGGNVLYIVDGTPVENFDAASLGADEIRSLDVRKDEAAAQFMTPAQRERYDRVVIITTKRGNTLEEPTPENSFKVFPNPGNQEVKVRFNLQEAGQLEFQLLDKEGGFLRAIEQDFPNTGEQEISIPVDELPADTYFLRVKLNGKHETRRVIVQ